MKKLSLTILLFIAFYTSINAQAPLDQCYYTDKDGKMWIRAKFDGSVYDPAYYFNPTTSVTAGYITYVEDLDGHSNDFIYQLDPDTYSPNYNLPFNNNNGESCVTGWEYYLATPIPETICPCYPVPLSTCIQDVGGGNLQVTLIFDHLVGIVDPTMYLFTKTGLSAPHYSAVVNFPAGYSNQAVYTFTFPATDLHSWSACGQPAELYFYNNTYWSDPSTMTSTNDPSVFAEKIQVAPCCAAACSPREDKFTYSINTAYPQTVCFSDAQPGTWQFGDGTNTGTDQYYYLDHNYGSSGSYSVILDATDPNNNSTCNKDPQPICLPTISQTESFTTLAVPHPCAGINFSVEFDNYGAVQLTASGLPAGSASIIDWDLFGSLATTTYSGPAFHQYSFSGSISPVIQLNTQYIPGGIGGPTCSITMGSECIYPKQAPNSVAQTKANIDKVTLGPNPATDVSNLMFTLSADETVKIKVYDVAGRIVIDMPSQQMSGGYHAVELNTKSLATGMYNISIQTSMGITTQKLSVIK